MAECYTNTTANIATALGFFSRMCSLQSLEMLESEHHLMTAGGIVAGGVANHPETYQRVEDWSRGGDGISRERSLWPACKCKVLGGISNGQPMWEPLSIAHGSGGGIQPKDTSG